MFNELVYASSPSSFKSNITLQRESNSAERIRIPIGDSEAKVTYYAVFAKTDQKRFHFLKDAIPHIDRRQTL